MGHDDAIEKAKEEEEEEGRMRMRHLRSGLEGQGRVYKGYLKVLMSRLDS